MKRRNYILTIVLLAIFAVNNLLAQAPEKIKYQAVLRDASGNILSNTPVTVLANILQGSSSGTSVYQETHSLTTTAQGVINLDLGGGTVNSGNFSGINWSTGSYWVKITLNGTEISNGQLMSSPYALSVKGITYDAVNSRIGIGTATPGTKLEVNGDITLSSGGDIRLQRIAGGGTPSLIYNDADDLLVNVNGALRMYFKSDGNVGIGTSSPANKLEVNGDIATQNGGDLVISGGSGTASRIWNGANEMVFQTNSRDMLKLNIGEGLVVKSQNSSTDGGQIIWEGIGGNSHYYIDNYTDGSPNDFRVVEGGNLRAYLQMGTNGWQTPSDLRLKDNIATLSVLDKIDGVRGCSYILKDSGKPQIGVIAQEMQKAFPLAVSGNESAGMLGVDYNAVAAIALQGVKELKAEIEQLKKENNQLKAMISAGNSASSK